MILVRVRDQYPQKRIIRKCEATDRVQREGVGIDNIEG
jgi:hypothetical protein